MNPADLPPQLHLDRALRGDALLAAVREIAQGPLAAQVEAIDRTGYYPCAELQQLAAVGAMSAHLDSTAGPADYGLAIRAMAEASRVCAATGFMMWCQAVCGLYLQQSGNPTLMGDVLQRHASGAGMGGTALSNPMKSYAQIESLLLKATPVEGGYLVNGTLPWVSNLGPDHYCGAIAAVVEADGAASPRLCSCCAATHRAWRCANAPASPPWRARAPMHCGSRTISSARPTPWPTLPGLSSPASALRS